MKHNKRSKKLSIKWSVFLYLLLGAAIILAMLYFFQIVHLEDFYKNVKTKDFKEAVGNIGKLYDDGNLAQYLDRVSEDYDVYVAVVDADGKMELQSDAKVFNMFAFADISFYAKLKYKVEQNGGELYYELNGDIFGANQLNNLLQDDNEPITGNANLYPADDGMHGHDKDQVPGTYPGREPVTESTSLLYIKSVTNSEGVSELLLVQARITPLTATVYTLRRQFIIIAIYFVVIAAIISFTISFIVAKPITRMNKAAKQLADGDFDVKFNGTGYREVQELSDTLNYAAEELGRTEKLRQDLIANVSHDLRTPLTMITAYSEVMRDLPGENTPENAQIIIDETMRLTTLVNDMLDLSKLQAGVMQITPTEFDFTDSIIAVMNRFAKLKEQEGYDIRFEYREKVRVLADEYKIYQVVYNLIINAINYAGEDKTVIVRQIVNGNIVRIEVEDHGRGIADEELKNIWDRYYKVDKTHKRAVQGTGLGLSIVQNILKMHDAKFGVRSSVGKGSVFWFELKTIEE